MTRPVRDAHGNIVEDGLDYAKMRWSYLASAAPDEQFMIMDQHVFPFLHTLGGGRDIAGPAYGHRTLHNSYAWTVIESGGPDL